MANDQSIFKDQSPNRPNRSQKYDLEERTAVFGERCIQFGKKIPVNPVTVEIIPQFIDATTSVGANYAEANEAQSKKDFRHKISVCNKESKESKYWLRMIATAEPKLRDDAANLWHEAKELNLIFSAIIRKCDGR
jgi:four helix bundle protein